MNYGILGKAILKTLAWMVGCGVSIGVAIFVLTILHDLSKPWGGVIVLSTVCIIIFGVSISDTYQKMKRKAGIK